MVFCYYSGLSIFTIGLTGNDEPDAVLWGTPPKPGVFRQPFFVMGPSWGKNGYFPHTVPFFGHVAGLCSPKVFLWAKNSSFFPQRLPAAKRQRNYF
jgi:hypothetical protein